VLEAKHVCPSVRVVAARPRLYVQYSRAIIELLHHFFVTITDLSIDEMSCVLCPSQQSIEGAKNVAQRVKNLIKKELGEAIRCSIGIAPNVFLAKVASDFEKPDGLTVFCGDYTGKLFSLELQDLPGIARNNAARLRAHGIFTVEDLWNAPLKKLRQVWGGTVGERWHYMLRGNLHTDYGVYSHGPKKSVSHSHVLPPTLRTEQGAKDMLLRLAAKALKRLRGYEQTAKCFGCSISFRNREDRSKRYRWEKHIVSFYNANDDICWLPQIEAQSKKLFVDPQYYPMKVSIYFFGLCDQKGQQLSFCADRTRYTNLFKCIDAMQDKYGCTAHIAQIFHLMHHAPFRISFNSPSRLDEKG
jgi:DNA polymerase-4